MPITSQSLVPRLTLLLLSGTAPACTSTGTAPFAPGRYPAQVHLPAEGCDEAAAAEFSFVLFFPSDGTWLSCNPARAQRRLLPASTFKIAHALLALDAQAVADEHEVIRWDGRNRGVAAWNRDTNMAEAMAHSTVWFFQALARRIGAARMRRGVRTLGYGNADIGPDEDLTHFWLDGALRISAFEQVEFLDRLRRRALPVSRRAQDLVTRILVVDQGDDWVLRAKSGAVLPLSGETGALLAANQASSRLGNVERTGWYVGWTEQNNHKPAVFAFNVSLRSPEDLARRATYAKALLRANGALRDTDTNVDIDTDTRPSPPNETPSPAAAVPEALTAKLVKLPQDVLAGTDLVPLADFLNALQPLSPGTFVSEQGGVIATARTSITDGRLTINRTLQEPSARTHVKTYGPLALHDGRRWAHGDNAVVLGVYEGLLLLETDAEADGIPKSHWVLYNP